LDARALQLAEGLIGQLTNTAIGGWADLRNVYGALQAQSPNGVYDRIKGPSAFDEYFHTADFRRGRGRSGWYNIPRLGVFLWRLYSFPLSAQQPDSLLAKPVRDGNPSCPNHYTFDPTGREIPLFAIAAGDNRFGDEWVSPAEWQLPTPISKTLLDLDKQKLLDKAGQINELYAGAGNPLRMNALGVFRNDTNNLLQFSNGSSDVSINPERGTLTVEKPRATDPDRLRVWYHYGFSSTLGAGVYDRRVKGKELAPTPGPVTSVSGGGNVSSPGDTGTVTIRDSLTYDGADDVGAAGAEINEVTIWANSAEVRGRGQSTRPLIRFQPGSEWTFTGAAGGKLHLEGIWVSGADLVLRGKFDHITISCCTFDPGNSGETLDPPAVFRKSIDGRNLVPSRLWIEGQVDQLVIDRSIVGPIRTRQNGTVETLTITDSIVQGIRSSGFGRLVAADIKDNLGLAARLANPQNAVDAFLRKRFPARSLRLLERVPDQPQTDKKVTATLLPVLNAELARTRLNDRELFREIPLTAPTSALLARTLKGTALTRLNRLLLEAAFPFELADSALALKSGEVRLVRCTVIGPASVHRLDASESILDGVFIVDDYQHGCVRFSAWTSGSILPRKYESVEIGLDAALFTSTLFGQPGYAQLLETVDAAVLPGQANSTIAEGAEDGSEMGAFAREKHPIKDRSLRIKYEEFMPIGLIPVIIYVT
jgi:hypothetical protein